MEHLTFEAFTKEIISQIRPYLPMGYETASIHAVSIPKPGSSDIAGISIQRDCSNTGAVFYVDELYYDYQCGVPFADILKDLAQRLMKRDAQFLFDNREWDKVKDRITGRLINIKLQSEYVENRLVKPIAASTMGIIYDIVLPRGEKGTRMLSITHEMMEKLKVTAEEIEQAACINTSRLRPLRMETMDFVLSRLQSEVKPSKADSPFWVITNQKMQYGAIAVTYPGVEEQLKELLGEFYLIPSSVHEMLAVSQEFIGPNALFSIICDVNHTSVMKDEVLDCVPYTLKQGLLQPIVPSSAK